MSSVQEPQMYICFVCSDVFPTPSLLWEHADSHKEDSTQCCLCGRVLAHTTGLNNHMLFHRPTGDKNHKCLICGKRFVSLSLLRLHMKIHAGEKLHKCLLCGEIFLLEADLEGHLQTYTDEKPYRSVPCQGGFTQSGALSKHNGQNDSEPQNISVMRSLRKEKRSLNGINVDDHCPSKESRIHSSFSNGLPHADTEQKYHACPFCCKVFSNRHGLNMHMVIHTGENPCKCFTCNKVLSNRKKLKVHMMIHNGEKPYKCSMCDKVFKYRHTLKRHVMIHTGEKPYKCSTCNKTFRQSGTLKAHIRTHTGEKIYECFVCQKKFTWHGNLNQHMLKHKTSDLGPSESIARGGTESCLIENDFTQSTSKTSDTRLSFKCLQCDKEFTLKRNLKRHIKIKHNKIDVDKYKEHGSVQSAVKMPILSSPDIGFECPECHGVFQNLEEVTDHIVEHFRTSQTNESLYRHTLISEQLGHNYEARSHTTEQVTGFLLTSNLGSDGMTHSGVLPQNSSHGRKANSVISELLGHTVENPSHASEQDNQFPQHVEQIIAVTPHSGDLHQWFSHGINAHSVISGLHDLRDETLSHTSEKDEEFPHPVELSNDMTQPSGGLHKKCSHTSKTDSPILKLLGHIDETISHTSEQDSNPPHRLNPSSGDTTNPGVLPHNVSHGSYAYPVISELLGHNIEALPHTSDQREVFPWLLEISNSDVVSHSGILPLSCTHGSNADTFVSELPGHICGTIPHTSEQDRDFHHPSEQSSNVTQHPGDLHYKCSHCNKEFSQLSELNQHMAILALIPSAEEDDEDMNNEFHTCTRCGKSFFLSSDLDTHSSDNTCSVCGSSFCEAEQLEDHLASHNMLCSGSEYSSQVKEEKANVYPTGILKYVATLDHSYCSSQT